MSTLRLFVISDAHVDSRPGQKDSYANTTAHVGDGQSPLHDLHKLAEALATNVDFVINAGDLGNRADEVGLAFGWRQLTDLASQLGADLLAVPGNHDVVTRRASALPRSAVRDLQPEMPTVDVAKNLAFWEKGWVIHETSEARFLLIDSTFGFPSFPIHAAEDSKEMEEYLDLLNRGVFSEEMQLQIFEALQGKPSKLNVAVLHHHPVEHQQRGYLQDSYGPMVRGSELIHLLSSNPELGRWFVIHGHKHLPQLVTASSSTSNGPFMLCAASASAVLWAPVISVARNQVHLVELTDEDPQFPQSLRGTVQSWSWGFGIGWTEPTSMGVELPHMTGFGSNDDFRITAHRIEEVLDSAGEPHLGWSDVVTKVPTLPYMSPWDQKYLVDYLDKVGIRVLLSRSGVIEQFVRK